MRISDWSSDVCSSDLNGPLEHTNEPYALAKIAGIKMCEAYNDQYGTHYASVMPTNLYGPNDNYDLHTSHVLPADRKRVVAGKSVSVRVDLGGRRMLKTKKRNRNKKSREARNYK